MHPQSVVGEAYLLQKLTKFPRLSISQDAQYTLVKWVHNERKYAKTDLTILHQFSKQLSADCFAKEAALEAIILELN